MRYRNGLGLCGMAAVLIAFGCLVTGCHQAVVDVDAAPANRSISEAAEPPVRREFRAIWVATVSNIDWPSAPGLPVAQQKQEALEILDRAAELNMNAVIFQVRPHCDALYRSDLEPWSYYLTGKQGKAPEPFYDPLEFWVEQAHLRGMQLHAWFNPYRVAHPSMKGDFSRNSLVRQKPGLVRQLEDGYYWMDPAEPGTQQHSLSVMLDVARRYDIDGVHMDDYFYPYPSYLGDKEFPDDAQWSKYLAEGGKLSRSDWRRLQVNTFIETLYRAVKKAKPRVQVGISPFGIWRPGYPRDIAGMDQYEVLYADARLWLEKGWVDYMVPQLYWPIGKEPQSFPLLLGWWKRQNPMGRHLWPGIYTSRVGDGSASEYDEEEVLGQVLVARGMLQQDAGSVHFSARLFMADRGRQLVRQLKSGPYRERALPPISPWLNVARPSRPEVSTIMEDSGLRVKWRPRSSGEKITCWVVHLGSGTGGRCLIYPLEQMDCLFEGRKLSATKRGSRVALHSADILGHLSMPFELWLEEEGAPPS